MTETPHTEPEGQESHEMSFFDHLEELRWRLIKAMVGIVLGMILCWVFIDWIILQVLLKPVSRHQCRTPFRSCAVPSAEP